MKGIGGHDYPGGHKGSLYNGVNNSTKSTNYSSKNIESSTKSDRKDCWPVGPTDMLCPTGKKCPEGMISSSNNPENNKCTNTSIPGLSDKKDSFNSLSRTFPDCWSNDIKDSNTLISARGSGISAGDSYTSYTSNGTYGGGKFSFSGNGSNVYAECKECEEKHELEQKPVYTLPASLTQFAWQHEPDYIMGPIMNEPNTFFKMPLNWDGGTYPLTWDNNRMKYFEKYDGKWYSSKLDESAKKTGHGYTPRTDMVHAYDDNDNLIKLPASPQRMNVWVSDLTKLPGRFQTTFYGVTLWSRPSYDPYMKRV